MSSPAVDMDLAFKTREKLTGANTTDGANLRRTVLLCNTYDTFQKRIQEHFCASNAQFVGLDRSEKTQINCREIAVADEEDEEDSDEEEENEEEQVRRRPPPFGEIEQPPPYEMHESIESAALAHRPDQDSTQTTPHVVVRDFAEVDGDTSDDETSEDDTAQDLPAYTAPAEEILDITKLDLGPETQHIEEVAEIKLEPPALPPRNTKRLRPGLASRLSFGHHTVRLSQDYAHGRMEVH